MDSLQIVCSKRIRELVAGGVIVLDAHVSRDGIELRCRATQAHKKLGILTSSSYTPEEMEALLTKVEANPLPSPSASPVKKKSKVTFEKEPGGVSLTGKLTLDSMGYRSNAGAAVDSRNRRLDRHKSNGVENQLLADSLTAVDFRRPARDLFARVCAIAERIGEARIVSRIASDDFYEISSGEPTDLSEWWNESNHFQKLRLLSSSKGRKTIEKDGGINYGILNVLPVPFQAPGVRLGNQTEEELPGETSESEGSDWLSSESQRDAGRLVWGSTN
jgi:hypothetical protein